MQQKNTDRLSGGKMVAIKKGWQLLKVANLPVL